MRHLLVQLKRLTADGRAAVSVEYALILAMVVLAMFGALANVGNDTRNMWNNISNKVTAAH
ncbi:Flp family type IVb pilin [Sphingomonas sp.]|uniref:Flp family type IVb pilin n=1 Tax=Sphingomonas sp. TaxID=28214 RepID=UPI003CC50838